MKKFNENLATVGSVNGIGEVSLPGNPTSQADFVNQLPGSGDNPNPMTLLPKKLKKKKYFKFFSDYKNLLK